MPSPTGDLLARLTVAEQEIARLREFRHTYSSDRLAILMKIEKFEIELTAFRDDLENDVADIARAHKRLDELMKQVDALTTKTGIYDRERGAAWSILKPIVITVLTAFVMWFGYQLLQMYRG